MIPVTLPQRCGSACRSHCILPIFLPPACSLQGFTFAAGAEQCLFWEAVHNTLQKHQWDFGSNHDPELSTVADRHSATCSSINSCGLHMLHCMPDMPMLCNRMKLPSTTSRRLSYAIVAAAADVPGGPGREWPQTLEVGLRSCQKAFEESCPNGFSEQAYAPSLPDSAHEHSTHIRTIHTSNISRSL